MDLATLSGSPFNGRLTGTGDDLESARFVAARFASLDLKPFPLTGQWLMSTETMVSRIADHPDPNLLPASDDKASTIQIGRDYLPIFDSPSVDISAPLVFVGYGISDPAHGWDEYAGIEAHQKIVVFLRGKPNGYTQPITHADKVRMAREKGASAFLTFTGPLLSSYETRRGIGPGPLAFYNQMGSDPSLPGAWIHTDLAALLFLKRSLVDIQRNLHAMRLQSFETETQMHLGWQDVHNKGMLHNVIGFLPAADPSSAQDFVVIGAHRDHFGKQAGLLFPGADDNASGTAIVLEVARIMASSGIKPRRSLLFVSFSGEEQGLLGSRYCVEQMGSLAKNIRAMINIDHAGVGNGRLTIGITGLEKSVALIAGERIGLKDSVDVYGFFPGGDHVPFHEAGIPTITVVSGGPHSHYHQTTDSFDTISPEILERTAAYVLALIQQLTSDVELDR